MKNQIAELDERIARLNVDIVGYRVAYENILKDNNKLRAEKEMIVKASVNRIGQADATIKQLHGIIDSIVGDAVQIVRDRFPESGERSCAEIDIANLAPLKLSAEGKENATDSTSG